MVKKEDISEEEPVTQEKDTKSQLSKRKRSRSGVTEDEVGDIYIVLVPDPNYPQCAHGLLQYQYTGIDIIMCQMHEMW